MKHQRLKEVPEDWVIPPRPSIELPLTSWEAQALLRLIAGAAEPADRPIGRYLATRILTLLHS